MDAQGRVLKQVQFGLVQKGALNRKRISLQGLAKGVYLLELQTGSDKEAVKFVIQ